MSPEVQAWIEAQKPELVAAAERYVESSQLSLQAPNRRDRRARVSMSQLRNLLNIAQTERSLAVFKNFLRYQVGRKSRGWEDQAAGELLEQLLLAEVAARSQGGGEAHGVEPRHLEAALLPLLIGYIIREYTYRCAQHGTSTDG
jgi:hypothetical protein